MRRACLWSVGSVVALLSAGCKSGGGGSKATGETENGSGTNAAATEPGTQSGGSPTSAGSLTGSGGTTSAADGTATAGTTTTDGETDTGTPACPYTPVEGSPAVGLELVGDGFDRPVLALGHPKEPDRLFVVEQGGAVRILEPGQRTAPADAFLEVEVNCADSATLSCEQGLLGFAFHPDFPEDPRVYIAYSPTEGGAAPTRISEFSLAKGDPNHVDMGSERIIIEGVQPAGNHNGGMIAFGPDGYLYIGLGDGGNGDDFFNTGRDTGVILAKILRIGVEPDGTPDTPASCQNCAVGNFDYTIPADNPFVGMEGFAPEIYAWGFRNPWRFSFDRETGLLYVGDVGQGAYEEIDVVNKGADYGWSAMEGNHCFPPQAECDTSAAPGQVNGAGMTAPLIDYPNAGSACSVTGGAAYRSCQVPAWDGVYFYGDYCSGDMWALSWDGRTVTDLGLAVEVGERIMGTGWNAWGDVFVTTVDSQAGLSSGPGRIYRLAPAR